MEAGNLWRICRIWFFRTLFSISFHTSVQKAKEQCSCWPDQLIAGMLTLICHDRHSCCDVVLFALTEQCTGCSQFLHLTHWRRSLEWKLAHEHFWIKKGYFFTSILCSLLAAAEKCRSSFRTARSLISSMLLLLIFRTQRDSCAKKSELWREKSLIYS